MPLKQRLFKYLLLYFIAFSLPLWAQAQQILAVSPDHKYYVQRSKGHLDSTLSNIELLDFINAQTKSKYFSIRSSWRAADAAWSPNSKLLYVNNRPTNSGDYLYIFSFKTGTPVILRMPGDGIFDALNAEYLKSHSTGRITIMADHWISNTSLAIIIGGGGYGNDITMAGTLIYDEQDGVSIEAGSLKIIGSK
jgi:hypothetical protein